MCVKFSISSVLTLDSQCPKIPYFGLFTDINVQLKPWFLTMYYIKLDQAYKMSDNGNDAHFSGVRFICIPNFAIKSALASLRLIMIRCGLQINLTTSKRT